MMPRRQELGSRKHQERPEREVFGGQKSGACWRLRSQFSIVLEVYTSLQPASCKDLLERGASVILRRIRPLGNRFKMLLSTTYFVSLHVPEQRQVHRALRLHDEIEPFSVGRLQEDCPVRPVWEDIQKTLCEKLAAVTLADAAKCRMFLPKVDDKTFL